jgi:hypothetical protein
MEDGCMVKENGNMSKLGKPIGINGCWSLIPYLVIFMFVWNALQYGVSQFFFCFLQGFQVG